MFLAETLLKECGAIMDITKKSFDELLHLVDSFASHPSKVVELANTQVQEAILKRAALFRPLVQLKSRQLSLSESSKFQALEKKLREFATQPKTAAARRQWSRDKLMCSFLEELGLWKLGLTKLAAIGRVTSRFGSTTKTKAPWLVDMLALPSEEDLGDRLLKAQENESPEATVARLCNWAKVPAVHRPNAKPKKSAKDTTGGDAKDKTGAEDKTDGDAPAKESTDGDAPAEEKTDGDAPAKESTDGDAPAEEKTDGDAPAKETDDNAPKHPAPPTPNNEDPDPSNLTTPKTPLGQTLSSPPHTPRAPHTPRKRKAETQWACETLDAEAHQFRSLTPSMQKRMRTTALCIMHACTEMDKGGTKGASTVETSEGETLTNKGASEEFENFCGISINF
jgi:hypothetical protein